MSNAEMPNTAIPPLAVSIDDWDMYDNPPTRIIVGRYRKVDGADITVCVAAIQDIHGQIDLVTNPPEILLNYSSYDASQARDLAEALDEAADELDEWMAWARASQSDCGTNAIAHACQPQLTQPEAPDPHLTHRKNERPATTGAAQSPPTNPAFRWAEILEAITPQQGWKTQT